MTEIPAAHEVLGVLDMIGGFVMIWTTQRITTAAGFRTPQARWALWRRAIYLLMAVAMFGLGCKRFFDDSDDLLSAIFQGMLLIGIMIFPLLRAFGFITQDMLMDGVRTDNYPRGQMTH